MVGGGGGGDFTKGISYTCIAYNKKGKVMAIN